MIDYHPDRLIITIETTEPQTFHKNLQIAILSLIQQKDAQVSSGDAATWYCLELLKELIQPSLSSAHSSYTKKPE